MDRDPWRSPAGARCSRIRRAPARGPGPPPAACPGSSVVEP
jgi:hypothetical protein